MKTKIKVLTIINSLEMGGIEKTLLSCLDFIPKEDFQMTICCFKKGGSLEEDYLKKGVKIIYIKKTGSIILDFLQLLVLLLRFPQDIVHSRFGFTSGGFAMATRLLSKAFIVSLHNTRANIEENFPHQQFLYKIIKLHLKLHKFLTKAFSNKIIGHSQANLDANYENWRQQPEKFQVLYNGVNFKKLDVLEGVSSDKLHQFVENSSFTLLNIGSLRKQKNQLFLIHIFSKLLLQDSRYKLIILGEGHLRETLQNEAQKLGISNNVLFAGQVTNITQYLKISDLLVFPSINEGLGNVVLEAQYKKLPVCASNISPLLESGYKKYHPYFFNPSSEEDCLKKLQIMISKIKNKDLEKEKEEAYQFTIENFSIEKMTASLIMLYQKSV